jgi:hypothetical protein
VNVTDDPGQKGLLDAVMLTDAGRLLFCNIMMVLLVAGLPIGHGIEEVRMQLTRSPFDGV